MVIPVTPGSGRDSGADLVPGYVESHAPADLTP